MPSWPAQGIRQLRPLNPNHYVCLPCRLRLFSTLPPPSFRHSTRLLDNHAPKETNKSATPQDTSQEVSGSSHENSDVPRISMVASNSPPNRSTKRLKHFAEKLVGFFRQNDLAPSAESHVASTGKAQAAHSAQDRAVPIAEDRAVPGPEDGVVPVSENSAAPVAVDQDVPTAGPRDAPTVKLQPVPAAKDQSTPVSKAIKGEGRPKTIAEILKSNGRPRPIAEAVKDSEETYGSNGDAIQSLKEAMLSIRQNPIKLRSSRRSRTKRKRFVNSPAPPTPERKQKDALRRQNDMKRGLKDLVDAQSISANRFEMQRVPVEQPRVPGLSYGLDRVLFNGGVYQLQDPHSKVYNFDPYLQKIMPVTEFDYDALSVYKTSSQDNFLTSFAKEQGKKYVGSTSSMTSALSHFHYLLSAWRKLDISMFSRDFPDTLQSFTALNRAPNAIFLRRKGDTYAIDADKEYDGANVLMLLGKSMEKLFTLPKSEFERYRKNSSNAITEEERNRPESYHYSTQGDFLLRSQLDAYDERLPGTGTFDLKTRAVLPIRMQSSDHEPMTGYEITQLQGQYESFEREYYDMMRSTALKYSLQARMGHMDGIFVAYHNVKRIFGFQYISINELDRILHGQTDRCLGNQEFGLSIELLNQIFDKATAKFPDQSLRFHFETRPAQALPFMYIFAEPMAEEDIDTIQNSQKKKIAEWERSLRDPDYKADNDLDDASQETPADLDGSAKSDATTDDRFVEQINALSEKTEPEAKEEEEETKPLLGMILTIRSKINGIPVERPELLTEKNEWSIDYTLTEIPTATRAWKEYNACKARRRKAFEKIGRADKRDPDSSTASYNEQYIAMLKDLSRKGRKMRRGLDKAEKDMPKVVLGEPYGRVEASQAIDTSEVKIEGVDDYLTWLYGQRESVVDKA